MKIKNIGREEVNLIKKDRILLERRFSFLYVLVVLGK